MCARISSVGANVNTQHHKHKPPLNLAHLNKTWSVKSCTFQLHSKSIFYLFSPNFWYSIKIDSVSVAQINLMELCELAFCNASIPINTTQYNTECVIWECVKRKREFVLKPHRIISCQITNFHLHTRIEQKNWKKKCGVIISIFPSVEIERLQVKIVWNGSNVCLITIIRLCVCMSFEMKRPKSNGLHHSPISKYRTNGSVRFSRNSRKKWYFSDIHLYMGNKHVSLPGNASNRWTIDSIMLSEP